MSSCGEVGEQHNANGERSPLPVQVQTIAESRILQEHLEYPGTIVSDQEVKVIAKASGIISSLSFEIGDSVQEGKALAYIDQGKDNPVKTSYDNALTAYHNADKLTSEQVQQATIALQQAEKSLQLSQTNYNNILISSEKDLQQAEIAKNQAVSSLKNLDITSSETYKAAQIAYKTAQVAEENARLALENRKKIAVQNTSDMQTNAETIANSISNLCSTLIDSINNITGFDENNTVVIPYKNNLGALYQQSLIDAKNLYELTKKANIAYTQKTFSTIEEKVDAVIALTEQTKKLIDSTKVLLENTIVSGTLPLSTTTPNGLSLNNLKNSVAGYQTQINNALGQINNTKQGLINVELNNTALLDSLQKAYDLAKKQKDAAAQNLNNLLAGTTSQKDQAGFGVQASYNQYENAKIKIQTQVEASKIQLDLAQLQYKNAKAALENAINARKNQLDTIMGQVNLATIQLDHLTITAPSSGKITKKLIAEGDTVAPGQVVAIISQTENLKVQSYVDQQYVSFLQPGMPIQIIGNTQQSFPGQIKNISPQADPVTKRFMIEVVPLSPDAHFPSPGVIVTVGIDIQQTPSTPQAIFVPLAAVSIGQNESYLFIVEEGKAKKIVIPTIDRVDGNHLEIRLDLPETTPIIIDGNKLVQDGDSVTLLPAPHSS